MEIKYRLSGDNVVLLILLQDNRECEQFIFNFSLNTKIKIVKIK